MKTLPRLHLDLQDAQRTLRTRNAEYAQYLKERRSVGAPPSNIDLRRLDQNVAAAQADVDRAQAAIAERSDGSPEQALVRLQKALAAAGAAYRDAAAALAGMPEAVQSKLSCAVREALHASSGELAAACEITRPFRHSRVRLLELPNLGIVECKVAK